MTIEEANKAVTRKLGKAINQKDFAIIDDMVAPDVVYHRPTGHDVIHGIDAYKQVLQGLHTAMPDYEFTLDDMIAEGNTVAMRFTLTGTFTGELRGIPPNHQKITIWGMVIDRIVDGKIVEKWERYDTLGFMQQLGVIPTKQ